ncbi:uncharacterized protein map4.S isoform X3 [Xenopus laevis]|uniref:Microtubule-associated protein n=1 Tax=Xenopus laevis TaxID=8355 RepID=A0A8J1L115_XENLA|nr:uncharacterized protein map4.S isoform X3 [Xenopus laevis]
MADLGHNFSLQDALTDGPAETEPEVKQDFITSLENEKFEDEVGETCDKSNYVPLLDDDDIKEPKNKLEHSAAPHESIMENGEHNLGENEVTDPFRSNHNENVLLDLPPFDTTNRPALLEHFEAEGTVSELNPFEEGWLTDSNSKTEGTDTPSEDISEITTGHTPSDCSIRVPLPLTQSDNMAGIWQPTAEEQLALSPHHPAEPYRSPEEATLLLPEGQASFDTYLHEGSREFKFQDQEKPEYEGAAELISCISFDAPLDPCAEPLRGNESLHESEEHAKESLIVEPAYSTVNEDSPEYLSVDAPNAQLVEQVDKAALLPAEGQLNEEVGQPAIAEDTVNKPVIEERDREGSTNNEELLELEEAEHQTGEIPLEKLDLVLEECKSDTLIPQAVETPSEQELILEEEHQNYQPQLPCEDFLSSKADDYLSTPKTEEQDWSPLKTEAELLALATPEAELLAPATPEAELLAPATPEAELLAPATPEAELLVPATPEAELLAPATPEAELLVPATPEAELLAPATPEAELLALATPESELLSPATPEAEVLTPDTPEAEVLTPDTPEAEVLAPGTPKAEVLAPGTPEAEVLAPDTPEAEVLAPDTPEAEVLAPPVLISPTHEARVLSTPKTDILDENRIETLHVPEDIPAQQAELDFEEAPLEQKPSAGSPVEEPSSVAETAPEKDDEHKAVSHVEFPQDIQASLKRGYKTSDRRFGRTKSTVVPVSGVLAEPHLGRQSAESRGFLVSRAKDLHKKAHDLMENRQETFKDGGEIDSAQALMKKKKKKPKQKKNTQTKVSEFFVEDDLDLNIRAQSELQVSGSEPLGQHKSVRRKHLMREVEQIHDPLMFSTTCSSTREAIEKEAKVEASLPAQCFTNEKQDPQNIMGKNPYTIAESQYMALDAALKDKTPLDNWGSILHEPEKSLDQMEANVALTDKVLTKCPYLKHVLKEVQQPEHSETYKSTTDTKTTTCPSANLPEDPILEADMAKSQLEAANLLCDKTKKADGRLNDNWISGPSEDFKPIHNVPETGGCKPNRIGKEEQASRKDKPSVEKSDDKEDTKQETVTAVVNMAEQDQRNNNTDRTQLKQPNSSEGQAVKSVSSSQSLVQVLPESDFASVNLQGLDPDFGIIPRPSASAKWDKPKRENERRNRSLRPYSESVLNADVAAPDSILVVDNSSSQSLAPKETIFEPLGIIEKETIALEQPSPVTFEAGDNKCLGEDSFLFQRQIKNKRGKSKMKAEIKASEATDSGPHSYSEPAAVFEGSGTRKPKETVSSVGRSERGSLKRAHGAEKTTSSVLPEILGNQRKPESEIVQSNVVDSPADVVAPSKEIMAVADHAVKEKEHDTQLAESLNVKPDIFTTFPKVQNIDQICKLDKSEHLDLPKHLNDDISILTAVSADINIKDIVTPEIKDKSTLQKDLKTSVDKPDTLYSLVARSLDNIDSKNELPNLGQENKIRSHGKTAHLTEVAVVACPDDKCKTSKLKEQNNIEVQKSDGENLSKLEESENWVVDLSGSNLLAVDNKSVATSLIDFHPEASLEATTGMLEGSIAAPICSEKCIVEEKLGHLDLSSLSQPLEKEQPSLLLPTESITEPHLPEDELSLVASLEKGPSKTEREKLLDESPASPPKPSHSGEIVKEVSKIKTESVPVTVKKEKTPPPSEKLLKNIPSKFEETVKASEPLKGYMRPTKARGFVSTLPKPPSSDTEKQRHLKDIHLVQQRPDKATPETVEPAAAATESEKTSPPSKKLPPSPERKAKTSAATPSKTPLSKSKVTGAAAAPSPKKPVSATPTQKKSASPAPASTTTPKRPLSSVSRLTSATPKDSKPKTLDLKSPVKSPDKKPAVPKQTPTSTTPRASVKASPVASKGSTTTAAAAPTTASTAPKSAVTPKRPTAPKNDVKPAEVKRIPSTKSPTEASRPKSVPADLTKANGPAAAPTRPRTTKPAVPKTTGASSTAVEAKKLPSARTAPLSKPSAAPLSKTSTAPLSKTTAAPKQPRPATVPDLKNIRSKIGSTDNIKHQPGGGKVDKKPVPISTARKPVPPAVPKTATAAKSTDTKETAQKQSNGKVQIVSKKLNYSHVQSKCGSKDNIKHVPGGGNVTNAAKPATGGTRPQASGAHKPASANVQILNKKIEMSKVSSKCGTKPSMKHKPGAAEANIGNSIKEEAAKTTQEESVKVEESQNTGEQVVPSQNGDPVTPTEFPKQEAQENGVGERSPAEGDNERESFSTLIPETSV